MTGIRNQACQCSGFVPYDYWYTLLSQYDCHVDFASMPEDAMELRKCVDELRASGSIQA